MDQHLETLARRAGEIDAMVEAIVAEDVPQSELARLVRRVAIIQAVKENPLMADPGDQAFWESRLDASAEALVEGVTLNSTRAKRIAYAKSAVDEIDQHVATLDLSARETNEFQTRRERALKAARAHHEPQRWAAPNPAAG